MLTTPKSSSQVGSSTALGTTSEVELRTHNNNYIQLNINETQ